MTYVVCGTGIMLFGILIFAYGAAMVMGVMGV